MEAGLANIRLGRGDDPAGSNLPRWSGRTRGHYEVWYITGNANDYGFWIRYTINVSEEDFNDWAGVWLAVFKKGEKPIGICRKFPLGDFKFDKKSFHISIGDDNSLWERGAKGRITVKDIRAEWEISFEPTGEVFKHLPEASYYLPVESNVLSPNPHLNFSGFIRLKDISKGEEKEINLSGGKGYQTHIWGKKHAFKWVWGHSNVILDENGNEVENSFFEALTVVIRRGPVRIPPVTFFAIKYKGKFIRFNGMKDALMNVASWEYSDDKVMWEIKSKKMDFSLSLKADRSNFIMATYDDPDGEHAFCHNSEIESAEISFKMNGKNIKLFCNGTFHTEFGARTPLEYNPTKFIYE